MKRLGYLGVFMIQCSYVPQIYRTLATRQVAGISPLFILLIWTGLNCLQVYSYSIRDRIFIISNWVGLISTSSLLIMLFLWGK